MATTQLGHKYADHLIGLHTSGAMPLNVFLGDRPWSIGDVVAQFARDDAERAAAAAWERRFASHVAVHLLDPYTLAHGLNDSPVGLASWIIERRRAWSDCGGDVERFFSKDDLLTTVMLYWVTGAFSSSVRFYAEAARNPWSPSHDGLPIISAPMGISVFEQDKAPGPSDWVHDVFNVDLAAGARRGWALLGDGGPRRHRHRHPRHLPSLAIRALGTSGPGRPGAVIPRP